MLNIEKKLNDLKESYYDKIILKNSEIFKKNNLNPHDIKITNKVIYIPFTYCEFFPVYEIKNTKEKFVLKYEFEEYKEILKQELEIYIKIFEKFKNDLKESNINIKTEFYNIDYYKDYLENYKIFKKNDKDLLYIPSIKKDEKIKYLKIFNFKNLNLLYKEYVGTNFIYLDWYDLDQKFTLKTINLFDLLSFEFIYPLKKLNIDLFLFYYYLVIIRKFNIFEDKNLSSEKFCKRIIEFENFFTDINDFIFKTPQFKIFLSKIKKFKEENDDL